MKERKQIQGRNECSTKHGNLCALTCMACPKTHQGNNGNSFVVSFTQSKVVPDEDNTVLVDCIRHTTYVKRIFVEGFAYDG